MQKLLVPLLVCIIIGSFVLTLYEYRAIALQEPSRSDVQVPTTTPNKSNVIQQRYDLDLSESKKPYVVKNGSVYSWGTLLPNADASTFTQLIPEFEHASSDMLFAKDMNHVYYKSTIVPGADPASFKFLNNFLAADKNRVYNTRERLHVLDGIDPATVKILSDNLALSGSALYEYVEGVELDQISTQTVDNDTIQVIDDTYVKDSEHVYWTPFGFRVTTHKPETFRTLGGNYYADGANIFVVRGCAKDNCLYEASLAPDSATFKVLTDGIAYDKRNVYRDDIIIKNLSPEGLAELTSTYAHTPSNFLRNLHGMYFIKYVKRPVESYEAFPLVNAEPNSFVVTSSESGEDATHKFVFDWSTNQVQVTTK